MGPPGWSFHSGTHTLHLQMGLNGRWGRRCWDCPYGKQATANKHRHRRRPRRRRQTKPYNVDPILQLGNLEVQRVARWMKSPFWGPCLAPGAMKLGWNEPRDRPNGVIIAALSTAPFCYIKFEWNRGSAKGSPSVLKETEPPKIWPESVWSSRGEIATSLSSASYAATIVETDDNVEEKEI